MLHGTIIFRMKDRSITRNTAGTLDDTVKGPSIEDHIQDMIEKYGMFEAVEIYITPITHAS